ncbi:MAG: type III restriction endonuclease subunit R [Negativicutes bacterium]|nr:type III restriction endonuclease subunit R [Negativicutes bacterium]
MKLQFDANLAYQEEAVSAVVDLFKGQTPKQANFSVADYTKQGTAWNENGIGNKLELDEEDILDNLQEIQLRNGIAQMEKLAKGKYDFDIEMETGTGKTYVYLRSILELYNNYGFSKFIIVVPSIAIKEGVYKSLQITKEHFAGLYDNTIYDYFVYDSSKLEQVRSFAVNDYISIMVINIDSFRKSFDNPDAENKANIIHRSKDSLNGMRPIDLIKETNPIVIVDEPQSVDTTPKSKEAIASLNPLCTFRYSATHVDKHNLIYKLDAVDSFDLELVKQIEVASFVSQDYHNNAYMLLKSMNNRRSPIKAKIEIDAIVNRAVKRKVVEVKAGDDMYEKSGSRDVYEGYIVDEIYCEEGNEYVSFTSKPDILRIGKAQGDIDDLAIKEQQIRKTIEEHLNKELILNPKGIKVLSLFFIDRVANYRIYDADGKAQKGIYAKLFEKHYNELIRRPKYRTLFGEIDLDTAAQDVHDGYFSIDGKKQIKDTKGNTQADDSTYNTIMKEKEYLLSFDSKLRFIFSHSALREGWDNPNVFQICTLNETNSNVKKRQEIGRGLRLCVNQKGERQFGFAVNTLTVMANESYEEFAAKLQKEYEEEEGIRFGILEKHSFANIPVKQTDGTNKYLGIEKSIQIYKCFEEQNHIDSYGKIQPSLQKAIKENVLVVPAEVNESKSAIIAICKKASSKLNIKSADDKKKIKLNKAVYISPEFQDLWERIKYKTTYAVDFDSSVLIEKCARRLQESLNISAAKLKYLKARYSVTEGGLLAREVANNALVLVEHVEILPDVITYLQNRTNLTRKTLVEILVKSDTLNLFKKNPQRYMEEVAEMISSEMRLMIVNGIKYTKLGDEEYYAQELFETEELTGYFERNMVESKKSVYEYVVYDSENERNFAESFEANDNIKLYAKLPDWFRIPTPIGTYNPDWAILIEQDDEKKLYFVLETKGNTLFESLRPTESGKIACGYKHFEALGSHVVFGKADRFDRFMDITSAK